MTGKVTGGRLLVKLVVLLVLLSTVVRVVVGRMLGSGTTAMGRS